MFFFLLQCRWELFQTTFVHSYGTECVQNVSLRLFAVVLEVLFYQYLLILLVTNFTSSLNCSVKEHFLKQYLLLHTEPIIYVFFSMLQCKRAFLNHINLLIHIRNPLLTFLPCCNVEELILIHTEPNLLMSSSFLWNNISWFIRNTILRLPPSDPTRNFIYWKNI